MSITPSSSTPRTGGLGRFGFQAGLAGAVAVPLAVAGLWMATGSGGEVEVRSADAPASLAMDDADETVRHVVDLGELGTVEILETDGVLVLGEVQVAEGWSVTELAMEADGAMRVTLADDDEQITAHIATTGVDDELAIEVGDPEPVAPKPALEPVAIDEAEKLEAGGESKDDESSDEDIDEKDVDEADEKKDTDHLDSDEPAEVQTRAEIDAEVGDVVIERDGDVLTYSLTRLDAGFTHHTWANGAEYVKGYLQNDTGTYWFKAWIEGEEIKTRSWFEKAEEKQNEDHDKDEPSEKDEPTDIQTRAEIDAEVGQIVVERDEWTLSYAVTSVMDGFDRVMVSDGGDQVKGYFTNGEHQYWFKAWIDGNTIKTRAWHEQVEPEVEVQTRAEIDAEVGQIVVERDEWTLSYAVTSVMDGFDRVMVSDGGDQVKGYFTNGEHQYWFKAWIDGNTIKTNAWFEQVEGVDEEA